jgi:hypothetical protein
MMTQEEKAIRYDEALSRAKNLHKDAIDMGEDIRAKQCEIIFPELKENEDERLKKTTIAFLKDFADKGYENAIECIAWLEKQGEKPQGKTALEAIKEEKIDNQNCVKPTDKVKPKFKVGDWVVSYGTVNQVTNVDEDGEGFTLDDGTYFSGIWKEGYRLWTIADAKDGDILASDNGVIILVKESRSSSWGYRLSCHCAVLYDGTFEPREFYVTPEVFFPATKEQCDLLFQKMKKAVYEWNANKKELNKEE